MLGKTHVSFGLFLGAAGASGVALITQDSFKLESLIIFYAGITLGALLPDIDEPNSIIGQKTLGVSNIFKAIFKHRGFTHSLFFVFLLGILLFICGVFLGNNVNFNALLKEIPFFYGFIRDAFNVSLNVDFGAWFEIFSFALLLGCLFHILGDMMTISGVPLMLPFSAKNYNALPKLLRFKTGGVVDLAVAAFSFLGFVFLNIKILGFHL